MLHGSPATSNQLRVRSEAMPRVVARPVEAPTTGEACDRLLDRASRILRLAGSIEIVEDLARFLGAASRVWTPARRQRLRTLIASAGEWSVAPVLAEVARHPRAEIVDEAQLVLRDLLRVAPQSAWKLAGAVLTHPNANVRALLAASLTHAREPQAHDALVRALDDVSPTVREAATWALANRGGRGVRRAIEVRIAKEADAKTREALRDALEELPR